jgi:hypothetical protein
MFGLMAIGIGAVLIFGGRVEYDLDMKPGDYTGIFSHLAIIALITERFVEIFTSVIRKPDRIELEGDIREATKAADKTRALEVLEAFKAKTGIFAMTISFITGLVIAAVGVRVMGPLFDSSGLSYSQSLFFNAIDIVITAGLIAGGSKGINSLTSSIGAVFSAMKYQSRATQERAKKDISS